MSTHKKRLSIIQTEATSISPADFLLTHAPFEHLYLDNDESTTENGVLNDLLLGKNDSHQFIMVQMVSLKYHRMYQPRIRVITLTTSHTEKTNSIRCRLWYTQ